MDFYSKAMRIQAIPFQQHETQMYNAVISAKDLVVMGKVDAWHSNHTLGYQREPETTRSKGFARHISSAEISPPSIIANIRDGDKDKVRYEKGHLEIPDEVSLWLVDGQHRVNGLKMLIETAGEKFADIQLPVVIMFGQPVYEEAKQFVVVNRYQKKVRTDLGERFLQKALVEEGMQNLTYKRYATGIEWIPNAIEAVDALNNDHHSLWHNKIKLPNEPKGTTVVSQKAFSDSLKPLLKEDATYFGKKANFIAPILNSYWEAIRELNPKVFDDPENHVMQKTTGVVVLHSIMPRLLQIIGKENPQKSDFLHVLSKIKSLKDTYKWSSPDGTYSKMTGQKGFMLIKLELLQELDAAIDTQAA